MESSVSGERRLTLWPSGTWPLMTDRMSCRWIPVVWLSPKPMTSHRSNPSGSSSVRDWILKDCNWRTWKRNSEQTPGEWALWAPDTRQMHLGATLVPSWCSRWRSSPPWRGWWPSHWMLTGLNWWNWTSQNPSGPGREPGLEGHPHTSARRRWWLPSGFSFVWNKVKEIREGFSLFLSLDFMDRVDTHSSVHSMTLHADSSLVNDVLDKQWRKSFAAIAIFFFNTSKSQGKKRH